MANTKYKSTRYRKKTAGRSLNGTDTSVLPHSTGGTRLTSFLAGSVGGFIGGCFIPNYGIYVGIGTGLAGNFIKNENGRSAVVGVGSGIALASVIKGALTGMAALAAGKDTLLAKFTGKDEKLAIMASGFTLPAATPQEPAKKDSPPPVETEVAGLGNIRYLSFERSTPKRAPGPEFAGLDMLLRDIDRHGEEMVAEAMRRESLKQNTVVPAYAEVQDDADEMNQLI